MEHCRRWSPTWWCPDRMLPPAARAVNGRFERKAACRWSRLERSPVVAARSTIGEHEQGTTGRLQRWQNPGEPTRITVGKFRGIVRATTARLRGRCEPLQDQVPEGHQEAAEGPRRLARLLRLPGRALGAPSHHHPDRIDLRDRAPPHDAIPENCVSRSSFLGLAFKLAEEAAKSWRRIRAPEKVAALLAGTRYADGLPVPDDPPEEQRDAA